MSRVAKNPVALPQGVEARIAGDLLSIKGPLGTLERRIVESVAVEIADGKIQCSAVAGKVNAHAMSGTIRALVNNMVIGVSKGFEHKLNLVGVGYRAQAQGDKVNLNLGFSHPVAHQLPAGVKAETPTQTEIVIKGIDKQQVGQVAAVIRGFRPVEPYKAKGIKYDDEIVLRKEGKKK